MIISVAAMIYTFFGTRKKDVDERFKSGSERMDRHEGRIASLEQTVQELPRKDDIHALHIQMTEVQGGMREMRAIMKGNQDIMRRLETIVTRHEDYLLDGSKK